MPTSITAPLTSDDDLLGMRLAHRVMRRDAAWLVRVADELDTNPSAFDRRRCAAVASYVELFATSIHHHHTVEDDVLWPLIVGAAGAHVDLTELTDDHQALDPTLEDLRRHAQCLPDPDAVAGFCRASRQLRDQLDEHIDEEERTVFPLITTYLRADAWECFEEGARRGGRMDFDLTRALAVVTPAEASRVRRAIPIALRGVVFALSCKQRRRERAAFGVDN
ncbi:hemerythrin HHE cation binding domain protein [Rhodococcus sp. MTM3W5.2]|uniref:hemerythrin domain-containing protein n=1 Tax=Rhodococcus sp. MTM3W5.2 TaxID=1805827 RepID=UPI00097935AA|nr:hemerythrin domain-containing protein [Rhodococcus sp. MTM3W5.2]AQA21714.1 hemerythrin HHE cation binding domain protein [Rhodococcus sp. MTM3W5.2]